MLPPSFFWPHFACEFCLANVYTLPRLIQELSRFLWFNLRSHHGLYDEVLKYDEAQDEDRLEELRRTKLTLTESIVAIVISVTCVSLHAVFLVQEIPPIVERGVSDNFMGLILVPLVEKAAEHLTAIDEAW